MAQKFQVILLQEASDFIDSLDEKARQSNDKELFKKLTNEIWEFRTLYNKTYYRLFAFWDKTDLNETLVISTNGLIKKTDKIPSSEIDRADRIRIKYFEQKNNK